MLAFPERVSYQPSLPKPNIERSDAEIYIHGLTRRYTSQLQVIHMNRRIARSPSTMYGYHLELEYYTAWKIL